MEREGEPVPYQMEGEPVSRQTEQSEQRESKDRGANVDIRNFWIRHAQKKSGEVTSAGGSAISTSSISESGAEGAKDYGTAISAYRDGTKGYRSDSARTGETLEGIIAGYQKANPDKPVRSKSVREALSVDMPEGFLTLYDQKFQEQKDKILESNGLSQDSFAGLTPDKQEEIAEAAEEPVIKEWLGDPNSELARLYPPAEVASRFAHLFSRRHERMARWLYSGSEIDLIHVTHKCITEPFLVSGVLIRKSDGVRITDLEQLSGSLATLGDWRSEVITDGGKNARIVVRIRGEEYEIDRSVLNKLTGKAEKSQAEESN